MFQTPLSPWHFDFRRIILDEIALEGLNGVSLSGLWKRLSYRMSVEMHSKMMEQYWSVVKSYDVMVSFYVQPEPAPEVSTVDRFSLTDEHGHLREPPEPPDGPYVYNPIKGELGSCQFYNEREEVPRDFVSSLSVEHVMSIWGDRFVIVASKEIRLRALAPHSFSSLREKPIQHTCLLELIGRSRENGITTAGITNVTKIITDPKHLFYMKKVLQDENLITSLTLIQKCGDRYSNCILMRLPRFTKPKLMTLPQHGVVHTVVTRLKDMPEKTDTFSNLQKAAGIDSKLLKKFLVRADLRNIIKLTFGPSMKKAKFKSQLPQLVKLELSSDNEECCEETEPTPECQYRVGVPILRQAYQRILEMGSEGMSLNDIAATMNIDINGTRALVKVLQKSNSIRTIVRDQGKLRIGRYIANTTQSENSSEYVKLKEELLQCMQEVPEQPYKHDMQSFIQQNRYEMASIDPVWNPENAITEIRQFQGYENQLPFSKSFDPSFNKLPSYRQILNAISIIRVIREKEVIYGVMELNHLVQKITKIELMDVKTLRRLMQRLILDNQLRYYKLKWPGHSNHFSILICAPYITVNHPIIRSNFRDIYLRAYRSAHLTKIEKTEKALSDDLNSDYYYPKYLRARKLHEFLCNMVYFSDYAKTSDLPSGCFNLVDLFPEMTLDLALGHMYAKNIELIELSKKTEILHKKIKECPLDVCMVLFSTSALILTVKRNLGTLVLFGLIQMCHETCVALDGATHLHKSIYYINRNAKVVNTKGVWPRDDKCEVFKFLFDSMDEVQEYWNVLYNVSIETNVQNDTNLISRLPEVSICTPDEAPLRDTGRVIPGNGKGAGGLDSMYYVQTPRYWNTSCVKTSNVVAVKRKLTEMQKFKPIVFPRKRRLVARKDNPKPKTKTKIVKKIIPKAPKHVNKTQVVQTNKIRNRYRYVPLKQWSPLEDKILMWTRVAKGIMSPNSMPWALQITNFVARDLIGCTVGPRPTVLCHNRATALEKEPSVMITKEKYLTELQKNPVIMEKYGNLCRKLRLRYIATRSKYIQEGILRMAELVWFISKLPETRTIDKVIPCVASDLRDLGNRFIVRLSKPDRLLRSYKSIEDILIHTAKEAVVQSMNSIMNAQPTMETSVIMYNLFKEFPENVLKTGLQESRKQGSVAKIKGVFTQKLSPEEALAHSSTYKVSVAYVRCWQNIYSSNFPGRVKEFLRSGVPSDDVECSGEATCVLLELSTAGNVDMFLTKSPRVKTLGGLSEPDSALSELDERVSVKLQRGKIGWKYVDESVRRGTDLFDDIALTNEISSLCRKSLFTPPTELSMSLEESCIVGMLEEKKEFGATLSELAEVIDMTLEVLQDNLKKLEVKRIIMKVGLSDNRVVLWSYAEPWLIKMDGSSMLPVPWITMDKTLKRSTFMGWCGAVAQKIIDFPGASIKKISQLCKHLTPRHVQDICDLLASVNCVQIKSIIMPDINLFSDDDEEIVLSDMYEFAHPEYVVVFPVVEFLSRYSLVHTKLSECAS